MHYAWFGLAWFGSHFSAGFQRKVCLKSNFEFCGSAQEPQTQSASLVEVE